MSKLSIVLCTVLAVLLIYQTVTKNELKKEYTENEDILVEYALELEEAVEDYEVLVDSLLNLPPILVKEPVYVKEVVKEVITQVDTLVVNSTGARIDTTFAINFKLLDKYVDSYFETQGITTFKWDYINNIPYDISTALTNSRISLNLSTEFAVEDIEKNEQQLTIDVLTSSPNVVISHVHNPSIILDRVHKPRPYRWGFGVIAGYGYSNQGLSPYIGVGATYTFIGLKQ